MPPHKSVAVDGALETQLIEAWGNGNQLSTAEINKILEEVKEKIVSIRKESPISDEIFKQIVVSTTIKRLRKMTRYIAENVTSNEKNSRRKC